MSWLPERCATTGRYLGPVGRLAGVGIRQHATTLYASLFRFDDVLLVNDHAYGVWACHSPVYQLRRRSTGTCSTFYTDTFETGLGGIKPLSRDTNRRARPPRSPPSRPCRTDVSRTHLLLGNFSYVTVVT